MFKYRLLWQLRGQEPTCQCRRPRFNPWVTKILWRRKCQPTQYSCLGNPLDRGAWRATVHVIAKESDMLQRLNSNNPLTLHPTQMSFLSSCSLHSEGLCCLFLENSFLYPPFALLQDKFLLVIQISVLCDCFRKALFGLCCQPMENHLTGEFSY